MEEKISARTREELVQAMRDRRGVAVRTRSTFSNVKRGSSRDSARPLAASSERPGAFRSSSKGSESERRAS